ncbi:YcaO-like family protein [Streptomyces yunnanensis]|uniref:Ribosomal protein S12 methylthiotransferase accessory factor n=1 Tax=Streptomyces yunnanensis TaxID=156453 RepID=A0A9X8MSJ6_9ACTN|nr:YcaO-like family protein [Streptomyces yunnanensis]SHL63586.1 ribosomal protein S12 methylthiotransferase accessory factor [Streptomyces yunnanensis]
MDVSRHELKQIASLVSPYGLVSRTTALPVADGDPDFAVRVSSIGDLSKVLYRMQGWSNDGDTGNLNGAGSALAGERARLISIAEALERYSICSWHDDDITVAAEAELTEDFVSPTRWPRCSAHEFARDDCGLVPYDPAVPIRWVRAWSLTRGCPVLVPAIAVYLHMAPHSPSERFIRGITTGAAVHSDIRSAVLGGLLEVVERDALSLAWLHRLRLPQLSVDPELLEPSVRAHHATGTGRHLEVRLFDATTDFGIPVVYAVQLSPHEEHLAQIVCATCDVDPQRAVSKIYRELASIRVALRGSMDRRPARRPEDGTVSVVGSAAYNASAERRHVFRHLLEGERDVRRLEELPDLSAAADPLATAVSQLAARGAETLVVDITTDEARQVGMHAVKVLVPEAVPLSFIHSERYLGTPRLYTAPTAMGHQSHGEQSLNPEPQPAA